jgi:hypothetical protein
LVLDGEKEVAVSQEAIRIPVMDLCCCGRSRDEMAVAPLSAAKMLFDGDDALHGVVDLSAIAEGVSDLLA